MVEDSNRGEAEPPFPTAAEDNNEDDEKADPDEAR